MKNLTCKNMFDNNKKVYHDDKLILFLNRNREIRTIVLADRR